MTEDEAIEIILDDKKEYERIIKELEDVTDINGNKPNETIQDCQKFVQAIKTILDLYQKEKEKNEELSTIKEGIRVLQNSGLMDEQYIVIANWNLKNTSYKHLLDDYISKDKIRAKIKELEEIVNRKFVVDNIKEKAEAKIDVLKELLERR
jgi:hypothetical protein